MTLNKLNGKDANKNTEKLLDDLSLKFINKKLEQNYENNNILGSKQNNKSLSLLSLILAGLTFILLITSSILNTQYGLSNNLLIEHLTNATIIEEIKDNISSISSDFLFYGNNILINMTLLQTGNFTKEECLLSPENQQYSNYVISSNLFNLKLANASLVIIFYLFFYYLSHFLKNYHHHKILFCFIIFLFDQSFQLTEGILIRAARFPIEGIFIILVVQVLIKVIITYRYVTNWLLFSLGSSLNTIIVCLVYFFIIPPTQSFVYYLIANLLVQIMSIIIAYLNEKKFRLGFFLSSNIYKERMYLADLIYKIDQGFIKYNNNILFLNDSMKKIISIFINENPKDYWEDNEKINLSPLLGIYENSSYYNKQEITNGQLLRSNVKPECKLLINKLFIHLTEFNQNLPEDLKSLFNNTDGKENNFDSFYEKVNENENFTNFTFLGNINIPSNGKESKKKYQIMFRVINCDKNMDDNYVEFMLNDVSEVVKNEREKAVIDTRSIYLSKIAHEFRNPISSIIELASGILDEINEKPKEISPVIQVSYTTDKKVIEHKANYIDKLCKVMLQFLTDYTLITNLKFACRENCKLILNNFIVCKGCEFKTCCKKCKICEICESKNETSFDVMEVVKNTNELFRNLSILERENMPIKFIEILENETNSKNNSIQIRTDEKLLKSAIYNIIFNSYKTSICINAEVKVLINQKYSINKESVMTKIEIINNSQEIHQNFINFLNKDEDFFLFEQKCMSFGVGNDLNNSDNIQVNNDIFNKTFEIYVAYFMIKKLGTSLNISSNQSGSTFSFTIINKIKDLNLSVHSNRTIFDPSNKISSGSISSSPEININAINSQLDNTILNEPVLFSYDETFFKINSSRTVIKSIKTSQKNSVSSIEFKNNNHNLHSGFLKGSHLGINTRDSNEYVSIEMNKSPRCIQLDFVNKITINNRVIRVLIIDDESMVRSSIKRHLNNINKSDDFSFDTEEASNCYEAIEILYKSLIQNLYFDIIVIDEYMPNMRGSTLIKLLKELNSENNFYKMHIISHTAFDTEEKKKFILDSGANFIIIKPVKFKDFKNLILEIIS